MRIMIIMIVLVMIIIEIIIMMIKKMIIIMIRCENENPLLSIQIFQKFAAAHGTKFAIPGQRKCRLICNAFPIDRSDYN